MSQPAKSAVVAPHVRWLILIIASIGFAFDIYELLMLPLILGPSLKELLNLTPGDKEFSYYFTLLFYVPAFAGGIFGLWGGYLTDRLGRRFVLTWSILLYAFSAFFAGFSTNIWMLLFFRTTCFVGVCVEFVAAVAWLAELFPDPIQREKALGYTQAFSSIGGLMVAIANGLAIDYASSLPAIGISGLFDVQDPHAAWRYTLMSGLIPALPLILIRPFLPESPAWEAKRQAGSLRRPSIAELFSPQLARTSWATMVGFACTLGVAFGAIQQMPQVVPGLKEVNVGAAAKAKEAGEKAQKIQLTEKDTAKGITLEGKRKAFVGAEVGKYKQKMAAEYTKMQEIGGLIGRFLMAFLLARAVNWGWILRAFQIPGMLLLPVLFYFFLRAENTTYFEIPLDAIKLGTIPVTTMSIGMMLLGFCTVAQLSFWGNYLPHMYPVHLRGTGESFAANIGGRLIGTSAAAVTAFVATSMPYGETEGPLKYSTAAAIVGTTIYVIGFLASFWLPEPSGEKEAH
jgi:MFS family permease